MFFAHTALSVANIAATAVVANGAVGVAVAVVVFKYYGVVVVVTNTVVANCDVCIVAIC